MTTFDELGRRILTRIETFLLDDFFIEGKNYDEYINSVEVFVSELVAPFKIIPYSFFPNFDKLDISEDSIISFFETKVIDKLLPFYSVIRNIDWSDYLADVNITHTEKENNTDFGNTFSMNETSPINASEEINTPNAKGKGNYSNTRNKSITKTDPEYSLEKFKTRNVFRDLFYNVQSAISSIFIEYNTLY